MLSGANLASLSLIRSFKRPSQSCVSIRFSSSVYNARENLNQLLEVSDRSSYILAQYIPEPARDAFLAIRAFNLEINKINDGGSNRQSTASKASSQLSLTMGISTVDVKFKFWSDLLSKIFQDPYSETTIGEPIAILLREALRNDLNLDIVYFHQFLQTRRHFLKTKTFQTAQDICSFGEGTYSQLNYLTQGLLLSPSISPSTISLLEYSPTLQLKVTDIAAHIGQATAISSMILGVEYYSKSRNQVTLPVDLMTKYELSQEDVFRITQGHSSSDLEDVREKLKSVVYDTAIVANDHILTARSKLVQVRDEIKEVVKENELKDSKLREFSKKWKAGIPDVIFTPFLVSIPTSLYLEKLEKCDFDILNKKMQQKEWKLAYRSYMGYHKRRI